jgi:hypothetical protein
MIAPNHLSTLLVEEAFHSFHSRLVAEQACERVPFLLGIGACRFQIGVGLGKPAS